MCQGASVNKNSFYLAVKDIGTIGTCNATWTNTEIYNTFIQRFQYWVHHLYIRRNVYNLKETIPAVIRGRFYFKILINADISISPYLDILYRPVRHKSLLVSPVILVAHGSAPGASSTLLCWRVPAITRFRTLPSHREISGSPQDDHQLAGQRWLEPGTDDMLSKSKNAFCLFFISQRILI